MRGKDGPVIVGDPWVKKIGHEISMGDFARCQNVEHVKEYLNSSKFYRPYDSIYSAVEYDII